jgi:hypothetical protein
VNPYSEGELHPENVTTGTAAVQMAAPDVPVSDQRKEIAPKDYYSDGIRRTTTWLPFF